MKRIKLTDLCPEGSSKVNERGEIHVLTSKFDFVVDRAGAGNARTLAAFLLGAAENRDPQGFEIVQRTNIAAPVHVPPRLKCENGGGK